MLYYITTTLARYVAVGSGESRDDCQGNSKSKKQKVITLRRELTLLSFEPQPHHPFQLFGARATHTPEQTQSAVLTLLSFEPQPHHPFQLFGARATHTPEQTQSAVLPMPRFLTGGSRANH